MARVLLLTGDLLFGSRVQGQLEAAGERVELVADADRARALLGDAAGTDARSDGETVLVADLSDASLGAVALVGSLAGDACPPTLGYYSHVEADVREAAERAGYDVVVARSRMAREGASLVASLLAARGR